MADKTDATETGAEGEVPKKSKLPLLLGLILALAGGGGGFFATFSGMIGGSDLEHGEKDSDAKVAEPLPPLAFVPIDPIIISLRSEGRSAHLRFRAELEVQAGEEAQVTLLMPRILDVLNTYLRAVEIAEIERPSALMSLRAQMLRRIQIVTGEGRVKDLLVTEFVVN